MKSEPTVPVIDIDEPGGNVAASAALGRASGVMLLTKNAANIESVPTPAGGMLGSAYLVEAEGAPAPKALNALLAAAGLTAHMHVQSLDRLDPSDLSSQPAKGRLFVVKPGASSLPGDARWDLDLKTYLRPARDFPGIVAK